MKTDQTRNFHLNRYAAFTLAATWAIPVILAGTFYLRNKSLHGQLNNERLKAESFYSEKLSLDKRIEVMKKEIGSLKGKHKEMGKLYEESWKKLLEREKEVDRAKHDNAGIPALRSKIRELEKSREALKNEIEALMNKTKKLEEENYQLQGSVSETRSEIAFLHEENASLRVIAANNCRIEAIKGRKEKLTINARKTSRLIVSLDIGTGTEKKLHFRLYTPSGKEISDFPETITTIHACETSSHHASIDNPKGDSGQFKRVELSFETGRKLQKGVYRFDFYNNNTYIGSSQIKLR